MRLRKAFAYHTPTPAALEKMGRLRAAFSELADLIEEVVPDPSRERSIAITELEHAANFANKAVIFADSNCQAADGVSASAIRIPLELADRIVEELDNIGRDPANEGEAAGEIIAEIGKIRAAAQ